MNPQYLGLGKTKFNSSVCLIDDANPKAPIELLLTERLNRKKNSGLWPEAALKKIQPKLRIGELKLAENRDVHRPNVIEDAQDKIFPFYDHLIKNNLDMFVSKFNKKIEYVPHHFAHAYAALALAPFERSIIVVMDGAGSEINPNEYEECSVFLQDGVKLTPVYQQTVNFDDNCANRIGGAYEKASEFIFNSSSASGKVMGLASYGTAQEYQSHLSFQKNLNWDNSFKGKSKKEWEGLDHKLFKDVAASVQKELERDYDKIISIIKNNYPQYENLILTGGCALNCTNNALIYYKKLFNKIFVPPFPGDESIGFGVAHYLKFKHRPESWEPVSFEKQSAYFGSIESCSNESQIIKEFEKDKFQITQLNSTPKEIAEILKNKNIIAWFQGRSESGPRALGNRSILCHPEIENLKDHLNTKVKFRESFRPYGCSVLYEKSHLYFEVEDGFDNPYMSYAIKVREEYKNSLKEVSHVDGTSRMQTVRKGQNEVFYNLINEFGNITGLYCLLNTSLNVMDEPILETVSDARRFMENTAINYIVIDNFLIKRLL